MTQQEHSAETEGAAIEQTPTAPPAGEQTPAAAPTGGTAAPAATGPVLPESLRADPNPDPTSTALSHNPQAGAEGDPNRVPSARGDVSHDSLFEMAGVPADRRGSQAPADTTVVKTFPGPDGKEVEAAATPPNATGAFGLALPSVGEVAGGNVVKTLDPPPPPDGTITPLTKERAALLSPIGQKLSKYFQRQPADWGILGPGDIVRGHMLLLDLHTGEKVRGMDDHRVGEGKLYANLRNFPESLTTGDTIDQILNAAP